MNFSLQSEEILEIRAWLYLAVKLAGPVTKANLICCDTFAAVLQDANVVVYWHLTTKYRNPRDSLSAGILVEAYYNV